MVAILPFVALIVLFALFVGVVSTKGYRLDMYLQIVFNEGVVLAVVATGAIFIYTLGTFDISLGAATLFAGSFGLQRHREYGSYDTCHICIWYHMFPPKFSIGISISHTGFRNYSSNDVSSDSSSITDHYNQGWCFGRDQYSKCGCKGYG